MERVRIDRAKLDPSIKPRIRVKARSSPGYESAQPSGKAWAQDSFQNFTSALGLGTNNQSTASFYGFNPISRNHTLLEWMYRGSWLVKRIIDCPADDMTRAGVTFNTDLPPDEKEQIDKFMSDLGLWHKLNQTIKWARLYGGAGCYVSIKGQRPDTPLRIETIGQGQFEGLVVLDRWMIWPHLQDLVTDRGPDFGKPKFYDVVADGLAIPRMRIHYTRFIRMEGIELPYWQSIQENLWGCSVIEPLYDRLVAFDSATTGAAQLVYKAHLRTYSVPKLRELIAAGGPIYQAFLQQVSIIRALQNNEGMTVIDAEDKFETHQYAFSGLSDIFLQFAQQLSGGASIPLTRLFGQAPAGLNATGDSDIRNYYDMVNADQNSRLRNPLAKLFEIVSLHLLGKPLPANFNFTFNALWQLSDSEKSDASSKISEAIIEAYEAGLINQMTALKELRAASRQTGIFTNITDEDIDAADGEPPKPDADLSLGMQQMSGARSPQRPDDFEKNLDNN